MTALQLAFQVTVVIASRNRLDKLAQTLKLLARQSTDNVSYEVLVVDDGSNPAVSPPSLPTAPVRTLRLEGAGRSAARNAGAAAARSALVLFLDDDISVGEDFVSRHVESHHRWPGALVVGAIRLPAEVLRTPFGRFRQRLEDDGVPLASGIVEARNFCAAGNMSMSVQRFEELGGFDVELASGEDQDLAFRHTAGGGVIAFAAEAIGVHRDDAMDVRAYCERVQWGAEHLIPFCRRHSEWRDNVERVRVNGPMRWREESPSAALRRLLKSVLTLAPARAALFAFVGLLERICPWERVLDRLYRVLIGVHMLRGYRSGLRRLGPW